MCVCVRVYDGQAADKCGITHSVYMRTHVRDESDSIFINDRKTLVSGVCVCVRITIVLISYERARDIYFIPAYPSRV